MNRKTITISVPHRLTQEQAQARIAAGVAQARAEHAGTFAQLDERWEGNRMEFRVGVLGQSVTGRLDVGPEEVQAEFDLPWVLAALADKLRPQLMDQTRRLLEGPASA